MTSGRIVPPVSPKEWNTGSTLSSLSAGEKVMRASACMTLASRLRFDSTTALGVPSEPEVNRMTAGFSASCRGSAKRQSSAAESFSNVPTLARISSSQTSFAPPFSTASMMSARPAFSTNALEDTTVRIAAVFTAAVTLAGPAV